MAESDKPEVVVAAGGIVTRGRGRDLEIALVQRDRYGEELSLPKGKVQSSDRGVLEAALREVREETGITAVAGDFAGIHEYPLGVGSKVVLFWWMESLSEGSVSDTSEVRHVVWHPAHAAAARLTHAGQRAFLEGVLSRRLSRAVPGRGGWARARRMLANPQLVRLREKIADLRLETLSPRTFAQPWFAEFCAHLVHAERAASIGDTDTGWGQVYRAQELQVMAMDPEQVVRDATELCIEVTESDKVNRWRGKAIKAHLSPIVAPGSPAQPAQAAQPVQPDQLREALRSALRVRNESSSNTYRSLTILRRHQFWLLLMAGIAITVAVVLILVGGPDIGAASPTEPWVMGASIAMGITGAAASAAQRSVGTDPGRLPKQLSSVVASISRIPIGAVAGLLVWLASLTGAAPAHDSVAFVLLGAFGAGFAERLIVPSAKGS